MSIKIDAGSMTSTLKGLEQVQDRLFEALRIVSHSAAKEMEAWAKQNAKWTDRTGNARQKLTGDVYWANPKVLETVLAHQVDYGVWLELAHNRKYAILEEAIKKKAPELFAQYRKLVKD